MEPPSISTEDLLDFHKSHFKGTPIGLERLDEPVNATCTSKPDEEQENDEEDDGLGYYPDGVKRTLTDKQIAFFRSSELRERVRESQKRNKELGDKRNQAKKLEINQNSNKPADRVSKKARTDFRESVEETKPFIPVPNPSSEYQRIYGQYSTYISGLDQAMDNRFIAAARREKVQDYYPVLPLRDM